MKLYLFDQNNSGGGWVIDDNLDQFVAIEAADEASALTAAEAMGIYLNGVEKDVDCECCGDRWFGPAEVKIVTKAAWPLNNFLPRETKFHYADGRRETKECYHLGREILFT